MSTKIIPAILESDEAILQNRIETALSFARTIHIDLIDSTFAQETVLIQPDFFAPFTQRAVFELHMMVKNPLDFVHDYAQVGFKRFIGHVEAEQDIEGFIKTVTNCKSEACLGFDLPTDIEPYKSALLHPQLSGVTVLSVKAGKSGQEFRPEALNKIKQIRILNERLIIEADGGINKHTLPLTKEAGATHFAASSFIFGDGNAEQRFNDLSLLAG